MKRFLSVLCALALVCLPGCAPSAAQEPETTEQFFSMDTVMKISVYGEHGEAAAAARAEVERLAGLLSRTLEDSQISQLNAHAGDGSFVTVAPEVLDLLHFAQWTAQALPGCFDITIAPVMDAWGFAGDSYRVPEPEELARLLPLVDSSALTLDTAARLEVTGMAVDLGALAKGYAASCAASAIQHAGADCALLDLGRNITAIGTKPDGSPWRVAVQDPQNPDSYLGVLSLADLQTCSTSGGYERYFEENGVRYHHIIDPTTGYPAQSGLLSVTVVSPAATLADALSTALFVAGKEDALEFWRTQEYFELILCGEDGVVTVTEGLEASFDFRGEEAGYTYEIARR